MSRKFVRLVGLFAIVAGLALIAWGVVVWQWGDPFTGAYTHWQQRKLSDQYERVVERFRPTRTGGSARPDRVRVTARRYRREVGVGAAIGRLRIPRIGVDMVLVNGTDAASLRRGPGRDPHTYMPGQGELVYIAGHRTTFGAPFAHIDRLEAGDRVSLEMPYGRFAYRVSKSVVVPASDVARLRSRGREELALQACHPRFSARERLIVYALPIRAGRERA
jgi:sortase A